MASSIKLPSLQQPLIVQPASYSSFHTDVCGPVSTASLGGCRYFVTFVDDYIRRVAVCPIRNKSDVVSKFMHYKALAERQTGELIKAVR